MRRWVWVPGLVVVVAGLLRPMGTVVAQPGFSGRRQGLIYGEDDRKDVFQVQDGDLKVRALSTTVALIPTSRLMRAGSEIVPGLGALTLSEVALCAISKEICLPLCRDERFVEQPMLAECSGVLIDDDLVLTAGHCFAKDDACSRYTYVFDFHYDRQQSLARIDQSAVYGCRRLVRHVQGTLDVPEQDFAIVQLDRPVDTSRVPVSLRTTPMSRGAAVTVFGFPVGSPLKIDEGGRVQDPRASQMDYFTATTDTFVGSSGSGIFDAEGRLAGHLVSGGEDFVVDATGQCLTVQVIEDNRPDLLYERAAYPRLWQEDLCGEGWPSQRLCGVSSQCGDGVCAGRETEVDCEEDCGSPSCVGFALDCSASLPRAPGFGAMRPGGCQLGRGATGVGFGALLSGAMLAAVALRRRWLTRVF